MSVSRICETCDTKDMSFAWTDTHGIAQCTTCGTPYRLLHYEGEGNDRKRVEKPPENIVDDEYKDVLRRYWSETHRVIPSGCSFPGGYELATLEDCDSFNKWMDAHMKDCMKSPATG